MQTIPSYLCDEWVTGAEPFETLLDPSTEEPLARASTVGLPVGPALEHARRVGGPALRRLSFQERGALLEAVSRALHGAREELIELAVRNGGNTRGDAKFDIDGATATLSAYAALGKQLGDKRWLLDGEPTEVAGARLQGWHVLAPRHGVAVHIGAFNFPTWGWAEKAACAWLAGVPVLTKPAPSTALVTWRSVELALQAGVLPAGTLSLLSGAPGELLDHVQWQDTIAFTGSSATGERIKSHPRVLASGARVNVEADSLNAAVLLPDAPPNVVDAFVRDVTRDITQKAGQKCTAIRRVLVPRALLEQVRERLCEALADVTVGDPSQDAVRMGPLTTALQRERFQAGVRELRTQTRVVFGEPAAQVQAAAPDKGFFVSPMLLEAAGALSAPRVHELEVFGPVATLLPYESVEEAAEAVRAGRGGLVSSLYGDDRQQLAALIEALSPWLGRLVVVDSKIADKSLAPGTVLPTLLHGGPGRAGGGEELGGLRGLRLYQQRTALQGNGGLLGKLVAVGS